MPQDLLWDVSEGYKTETYIAPSWSWASTIGSVRPNGAGRRVPCAEVVEAVSEVAGADQFGQVKGGFLIVRAPAVRAGLTRRVNPAVKDDEGPPVFDVKLVSLPDGVFMDEEHLSLDQKDPPDYQGQVVLLVPLVQADEIYYAYKDKEHQPRLVWALLLVGSQEWAGSFERIGMTKCKVTKEILAQREEIKIR